MTEAEILENMQMASAGINDTFSVMIGVQFALFVAVYYLSDRRTLWINHGLFLLYSSSMVSGILKIILDFNVIKALRQEVVRQIADGTPMHVVTSIGSPAGSQGSFWLFMGLFSLLGVVSAYIVYRHSFDDDKGSA